MLRPAGVTTGKCYDRRVLQPVGVTTGGCYDWWVLRLVGVTTGRCYDRWVLRPVGVTNFILFTLRLFCTFIGRQKICAAPNTGLVLCWHFSTFGVQIFKEAFVLADKYFFVNPHSTKPVVGGNTIKKNGVYQIASCDSKF